MHVIPDCQLLVGQIKEDALMQLIALTKVYFTEE